MRRPIIIDAAQTTTIDGVQSEMFVLNLDTSISTLRIRNLTPGLLYCFIVKQNYAGGHTVAWGDNVCNASAVDPRPNATTIQNFVANSDGKLYANTPPTWQ
jgi:hypothetical protein